MARAICRRAERQVLPLIEMGETDSEPGVEYLPRNIFKFTATYGLV